jgi:hypothetical protein
MSHTTPITTNPEITLAYVIRLSWDQGSGEWRILLKPVNGQEARLFGDVESTLVYLEAVMQKECKEEQE